MKKIALIALVSIAGCASSGVVPMDKGTYLISKRSAQLGMGAPVGTKAEVYTEASDFCAKQKMNLETVNFQMTESGFGSPGTVSLQFKCIP